MKWNASKCLFSVSPPQPPLPSSLSYALYLLPNHLPYSLSQSILIVHFNHSLLAPPCSALPGLAPPLLHHPGPTHLMETILGILKVSTFELFIMFVWLCYVGFHWNSLCCVLELFSWWSFFWFELKGMKWWSLRERERGGGGVLCRWNEFVFFFFLLETIFLVEFQP